MLTIKTGRKTTEFLITLAVVGVLIAAGATSLATLPGKWGAIAVAVSGVASSIATAAYSLGRSNVKAAHVTAQAATAATTKPA